MNIEKSIIALIAFVCMFMTVHTEAQLRGRKFRSAGPSSFWSSERILDEFEEPYEEIDATFGVYFPITDWVIKKIVRDKQQYGADEFVGGAVGPIIRAATPIVRKAAPVVGRWAAKQLGRQALTNRVTGQNMGHSRRSAATHRSRRDEQYNLDRFGPEQVM